MWNNDGAVLFWQSNYLGAGQGVCVVEFMFDGAALKEPVNDLLLTVRVYDASHKNLGTGTFSLMNALGGTQANRYQSGAFEGISHWEIPIPEDNGEGSPLCWNGVALQIESAIGQQSGKQINLVQSKQLVLTALRKVKIQVRQ